MLDNPPVPHDEDLVDTLGGDTHVVRDEQQPHAGLLAQRVQQIEDLGLDGDVQRGRRLVGDQQFGFAGQRHRDESTLSHAAAELVRTGTGPPRCVRDSHPVQYVHRTRACRPARRPRVHAIHLGDLVPDRVVRVEGRQRILEDHRGLRPPQPPQSVVRRLPYVDTGDRDRAADARAGAAVQAQQGRGDRGLAGAGLADQGEGGAPLQPEGEPVDGTQLAELDGQVPYVDEAVGRSLLEVAHVSTTRRSATA
ncbi:hypothetical protein SALBM311S_09127 [Streptomyces alboniger]